MSHTPRQALPMPDPVPLTPPADFAERLSALGVTLDEPALARLTDYLGRLLAMNALMNLTAIKDPSEVWTRHAFDALTLVPLLADLPAKARVVDVGSGGGVPGVPIAIARPDLKVTLVEATQKKAAFLTGLAAALPLGNLWVRAQRAEIAGRSDLHTAFDVATARAVGRIALLVPLMVPFVKPGGRVLLVKGQRADEELAEATRVLGQQRCFHEKTVPTPTGRIVVLRRSAGELKQKSRRPA